MVPLKAQVALKHQFKEGNLTCKSSGWGTVSLERRQFIGTKAQGGISP